MANETGKERYSRIQQDYFRHDPIVRWRGVFALSAMAAALGWWLLAPVVDESQHTRIKFLQGQRLASPGLLASAHAPWESQCEACHVRFQPIDRSRWSPTVWFAALQTGPLRETCTKCHAGPRHHRNETALGANTISGKSPACADCHHDHRGRDARLTKSEDDTCIRCHSNLPGNGLINPRITQSVSRFDRDHHPEFALIRDQKLRGSVPRDLEFSHAVHMAPGLTLEPKPLKEALFTFKNLKPTDQKRLGYDPAQPLDTPVKLDCADCHRLDGDESRRASGRSASDVPARSAGDVFLPITYENHCRACHSLGFEKRSNAVAAGALSTSPELIEVRHGLTPPEVLAEVRKFYTAEAVNADSALMDRFVPPRRVPNQDPDVAVERVRQAIERKVLPALKSLFGSGQKGCLECHKMTPDPFKLVRSENLETAAITSVKSPKVWLPGAAFDHSAHRAVRCLECHSQALKQTKETKDVLLIPGIDNCIQCHAPAEVKAGVSRGGAGRHCTECHRYHNLDNPLAGRGSSTREAEFRFTIDGFLNTEPRSSGH